MGQAVSQQWMALWNQKNTRREYAFEIDGVWYGDEQEVEHSVEGALYEEFGIGNAYTSSLNIGLYARDIPRGAEIRRYVRLVNGEDVSEWIPKGIFFANRRTEDDGYWMIEAFDSMRKADVVWTPDQSLVFPLSMKDAVTEFARIMGVVLDSRTVLNGEYTIDYPANDYTIRDELAFIAAAHGGNWIISDAGQLLLVPLCSAPEETNHLVNERGAAIVLGGVVLHV